MSKNEFLPFGVADGADVMSPDDYQKFPMRESGFGTGVAESTQLNTVWRQASVIAATVAQFIANKTGQDVLDNGDLDALLTQLNTALALPDGTTKQKGIVQLSSATDSDDETMAATPKAVKSVADKMGTVKTITTGTNTHDPDEHGDIKLGTAADADLTTSPTDSTQGHVLKVGDHGVGGDVLLAADTALSSPAGYPSGFFKQSGNADDNRYASYGAGVNLQYAVTEDEGTYYGRVFVRHDGHLIAEWLHVNSDGTIAEQHVNELYGALNKPTTTDIGALPITGGTLRGGLHFLFLGARPDANCMIANDDASGILACAYGYYQDRFDIHFYDEKGAWESNPLAIGRNGNTTVSGNLSGAAVFEGNQRVYSPNNPPPAADLSGYATQQWVGAQGYATTGWVMNNTIQGFRMGARMQHDFNSGGGPVDSGGTSVVSFALHGGSDNGGTSATRYAQFLINGVWANAGAVD